MTFPVVWILVLSGRFDNSSELLIIFGGEKLRRIKRMNIPKIVRMNDGFFIPNKGNFIHKKPSGFLA